MKEKLKKWKNISLYILSFVITFGFYLISLLARNDIEVSQDEIGALANMAYRAGLNWSDTISHSRYYGYGFFWILSPLYRISTNPYFIYNAIYVCCTLVICITSIMILYMMIHYLGYEKNIRTAFVSVIPAIGKTIVSTNYICNETPLYFSFWLLILLFIIYVNSNKRVSKIIVSIFSALAITYMYTCHERTDAVLVSVVISIIVVRVVYKKWIINPFIFGGLLIGGYLFKELYKNEVIIQRFWANSGKLANTSATSVIRISAILTPLGVKSVWDIFITNIFTLVERTLGLFGISVIFFLCSMFGIIKDWKKRDTSKLDVNIGIANIISITTVIVVVGGLGIMWGKHVYQVILGNEELGVYYRAYTYIRYYECFFGPAIVATIAALDKKNSESRNKILSGSCIAFLISYIYIIAFIYENTFKQWKMSHRLAIFSISDNGYEGIVFSFILVLIVILFSMKISWKKLPFVVVGFLTLYAVLFTDFGPNTCSQAGASRKFYENNLYLYYSDLDRVYVYKNHSCFQFMLPEVQVIRIDCVEDKGDDYIIFAPNDSISIEKEDKDNVACLKLDDNEYVYLIGKYAKIVENY